MADGSSDETTAEFVRKPLPTVFGPVELVSVKSNVDASSLREVDYYLHEDLAGELETLNLPDDGERFELSAAVVELDTHPMGRGLVASCVVSTTITHPTRGIVATTRGKARAV